MEPNRCENGHVSMMWLRIPESMASPTDDTKQMIFSSSGETNKCNEGCIAAYIRQGTLRVEFRIRNRFRRWYCTFIDVPFQKWFHLTVAWDKSHLKTFVDGQLQDQASFSDFSYPRPTSALRFGGRMYLAASHLKLSLHSRSLVEERNNISYGSFDIDEWLFWDATITDQDVKDYYNSELFILFL